MALDVAEYLWNKFLRSLGEAESEISNSTFISDFRAIRNVVKEIERPGSNSYSKTIRVLYELNDILEECRIVPHEGEELTVRLFLFSPSTYIFIQKMKTRLNNIKREIESLQEDLRKDNLPKKIGGEEISNSFCFLATPSQVFGFDDLEKKIEGMLFEGGPSRAGFTAVGVVGIAGVGKTTLVQKVLDSQIVKGEFSPIVWLPFAGLTEQQQLSRFSFETFILDNLGQTTDSGRILGLGKLLERLNQLLSGKRYLIVFDDVCPLHINVEERLWHGLPKSRGGAVIVTSRSKEVVLKLVEPKNLVLVKPLDREICWHIFEETIKNDREFSSSSQHETIEKIKEEIKDQCHGVPLAAKTFAEIIAKQIR